MDDTTSPLMPDYDPDWEARWDRANALFQQRKSEVEGIHFTAEAYGPAMEALVAAGAAMQAAFIAQFRTVDEYRDWRLNWLWNWQWHGRPVPRMPDGLSVTEVRRRMAAAHELLAPLCIIGRPEADDAVFEEAERMEAERMEAERAFRGQSVYIVVGECRDTETMAAAVQAAISGHFVTTTPTRLSNHTFMTVGPEDAAAVYSRVEAILKDGLDA